MIQKFLLLPYTTPRSFYLLIHFFGTYYEDLHTYKGVERLKETLPYVRQREHEKTFQTMTNEVLKVCEKNIKQEGN
jgi:hypothetical protein